jgi:hypothetical protein
MHLVGRLRGAAGDRNREIIGEAIIELALGIIFSALTFGAVFLVTWVIFYFGAGPLSGRNLALLVTGIFALVSVFEAWRRVDPLAGLEPMTERQLRLTMISISTPGITYFSPRHATAGIATLFIGGPANVFSALGNWRHRLRYDGALIEAAASVLAAAADGVPVEAVESPRAALLLHRLALVKIGSDARGDILELTEKGRTMLRG